MQMSSFVRFQENSNTFKSFVRTRISKFAPWSQSIVLSTPCWQLQLLKNSNYLVCVLYLYQSCIRYFLVAVYRDQSVVLPSFGESWCQYLPSSPESLWTWLVVVRTLCRKGLQSCLKQHKYVKVTVVRSINSGATKRTKSQQLLGNTQICLLFPSLPPTASFGKIVSWRRLVRMKGTFGPSVRKRCPLLQRQRRCLVKMIRSQVMWCLIRRKHAFTLLL